jgi:hypothetical protein
MENTIELLNDQVYPNLEKFGINDEVGYGLSFNHTTNEYILNILPNESGIAPMELRYKLLKPLEAFTEVERERVADYVGMPDMAEIQLRDVWLHGEFVDILPTYKEIEEAKVLLRKGGYFTDNLWCIEDVQNRFKCDDETAQAILNRVLTNEATMEQIHYAIGDAGEFEGLETI